MNPRWTDVPTPRSVSSIGSLEIVVDALQDAHAARELGIPAASEWVELRAFVLERAQGGHRRMG